MELADLGIEDPEKFKWQDIALCKNMPLEWFFEQYESDPTHARIVDSMCMACPIRAECLQFGTTTQAFGVFGAVYLQWGKPDKQRNKHKSQKLRKELECS